MGRARLARQSVSIGAGCELVGSAFLNFLNSLRSFLKSKFVDERIVKR